MPFKKWSIGNKFINSLLLALLLLSFSIILQTSPKCHAHDALRRGGRSGAGGGVFHTNMQDMPHGAFRRRRAAHTSDLQTTRRTRCYAAPECTAQSG